MLRGSFCKVLHLGQVGCAVRRSTLVTTTTTAAAGVAASSDGDKTRGCVNTRPACRPTSKQQNISSTHFMYHRGRLLGVEESRATYPGITPANMMTTVRDTVKNRLNELLTRTNTLLSESKTKGLCEYYSKLIPEDKKAFLNILATDYGVDQADISHFTKTMNFSHDQDQGTLIRMQERLRQALVPRYQYLFTQIARQEGGVKFLVDLRSDVLSLLDENFAQPDPCYLQSLSQRLRDLFSLWFSVGFLQLERITWESPCDMLQKISEYEAVHPIRNWTDIKHRVGPYRRCFVYTHASMPREPVVVLHMALTKQISTSIQSIVERTRAGYETNQEADCTAMAENPSNISTAIFYSITSTQKGLQGVELGNYIIKKAVRQVLSEFPHVYQFSSLSPIPGFKIWLMKEINRHIQRQEIGETQDNEVTLLTAEERADISSLLGCPPNKSVLVMLKKTLLTNTWAQDEQLANSLKRPLLRLCARYLYIEKRRGFALNPVANFHLRNGAMMWHINWLADTTARGLSTACGLMVNYRYFLDQTEDNSRQYMDTQEIPASEQVLELVQNIPRINSQDCSSNASS